MQLEPLTTTEYKVVELASKGLTNTAIATTLGVKSATVGTHLVTAFSKLDVHKRSELPGLLATGTVTCKDKRSAKLG